MRIVMQNSEWVVLATWLGAERIVYSNTNVFACIRFVANNK